MIMKSMLYISLIKHVTEQIDQSTPTGHQVFFLLSLLQHVISCSFIKKGTLIFFLFGSVTQETAEKKSDFYSKIFSYILVV